MKPLCDIPNVDVQGTPFYQTGAVVIQGLIHSLYVDPFDQQYHFSGKGNDNPKIREVDMIITPAHLNVCLLVLLRSCPLNVPQTSVPFP
jgi:hypothetical protein